MYIPYHFYLTNRGTIAYSLEPIPGTTYTHGALMHLLSDYADARKSEGLQAHELLLDFILELQRLTESRIKVGVWDVPDEELFFDFRKV